MALYLNSVTISNHRLLSNSKLYQVLRWGTVMCPPSIYVFMACVGTNLPL